MDRVSGVWWGGVVIPPISHFYAGEKKDLEFEGLFLRWAPRETRAFHIIRGLQLNYEGRDTCRDTKRHGLLECAPPYVVSHR